MRYTILTLFPGLIRPWLSESLLEKALARGLLEVRIKDLRDFAKDRHRTVDDTPYGGGPGMVIKPEVAVEAIEWALPADEVILLSPAGEVFTQETARALAQKSHLVLLAGRYEGFDARVERFVTRVLSIGDYVLMGGEAAALVVLEATARLVPGVIGDERSHQEDSFSRGLLDFPQYTRPPLFRGLPVPEVLLSGDHKEIERFRRREALRKTLLLRPELLAQARLSREEVAFLAELDRDGYT
ncbi:tRNA (guanosine(37)-N1)-methyltransferase TrmD [Thermus filiformis]|uniref:tRNA (guanine-N(1)-)-methyltransferase n=1 Tax=Thermus filiformis TaxID=276 RepID=A0A0D6X9G2_THEFI|nr:tRNA (guanosine(37)-N1)-methyltransferase TrmD [Thermus filiformis]KIX84534.1 tRNA (guanine-N1)-methyltransferase [Thermus filiformis]